MYSFDSRVRYSEVDYEGNMTLKFMLDYFQDCCSFHSEDTHRGIDFLKEKDCAWVLAAWQVEVERYPGYGERITVGTWPYDFKGYFGHRNFVMKDEAGNQLACANSTWVLVSTKTSHPIRVLQEIAEAYRLEEALPMENEDRKIKLPDNLEGFTPFAVQKFHLDTNHHVNNGKYVLMAQEYLPDDFSVGKMRAEYKNAAVYGDTIYPFAAIEESRAVIALCDRQQKPYAIVELEKKYD